MADEATPQEQRTDESPRTATKRTARARKAQTVEPLSVDISDAIAAELQELKEEAPKRTARRKPKAKVENAEEILEHLVPEVTSDEPSEEKPKAKRGRPRKAVSVESSAEEKPEANEPAPEPVPSLAADPFFVGAPQEESEAAPIAPVTLAPMTALLFQEPDVSRARPTRRRKVQPVTDTPDDTVEADETDASPEGESASHESKEPEQTRRRRGSRGRGKSNVDDEKPENDRTEDENTEDKSDEPVQSSDDETVGVTRRRRRRRSTEASDEVSAPKGSTRLEAKRQRRKEGREAGRRRHSITESEYLARRESVKREMLVREQDGLNQIAVLEDDVLVEHYVARHTQVSMVGNVYLGRVQNVLPSMEAAFVDIGKGRNAVLYAGEVNWEAAGLEGKPRRIEQALKSGDTVLVQVTKDPIGHKGARLTAQITLAGRHLVLVPSGAMTGISRKLPEKERQRLKKLLREIVPAEHGVIVRTAAEGATEEQLRADVERLTKSWADIQEKSKSYKSAPTLLKGEPELAVRVVRDIFNEDFQALRVQGDDAWKTISEYVGELSPELVSRLSHWTSSKDIFAEHRVDEQLAKAFDRKVWLPSGGTLVIDRTEAMTVIDVNTGKFTGSGGTLEETVTRNNLEAAEEIVRQLRLRDIGGIIVVDFIDMVLEANRELVLRRLVECLGRDRTRHQVAEVTSLGLVQMTRKRVGQGLVEAFSTTCEACEGRGFITHTHPVERSDGFSESNNRRKQKATKASQPEQAPADDDSKRDDVKAALNSIAAAAAKEHDSDPTPVGNEETSAHSDDASAKTSTSAAKRGRGRKTKAESKPKNKTEQSEAASASSENDSSQATSSDVTEEAAPEKPKRGRGHAKATPDDAPTGKAAGAKRSRKRTADVEDASTPASPEPEEASEDTRKPKRARRVSSSGTITPGAGQKNDPASFVLSFPAQ
ncbi:Rne/Rng family ribonuclease [Arcanobacterium haemolyticum]|nr:Rne/Rng family ribonuclease [Arcanobacterium haemolyticum]